MSFNCKPMRVSTPDWLANISPAKTNTRCSLDFGGGTDAVFVTVSGWTVTSANIEAVYLSVAGSLTGSGGDDALVATGVLNAVLDGAGGDDTLWGGGGQDALNGGAGNDVLRAGAGHDTLQGGAGDDQLVGSTGADRFLYAEASTGYDQIFDFNRGEGDRIVFAGAGSGITGFAQLNIYEAGMHSVVTWAANRIDVYDVTGLSASDFLFS